MAKCPVPVDSVSVFCSASLGCVLSGILCCTIELTVCSRALENYAVSTIGTRGSMQYLCLTHICLGPRDFLDTAQRAEVFKLQFHTMPPRAFIHSELDAFSVSY